MLAYRIYRASAMLVLRLPHHIHTRRQILCKNAGGQHSVIGTDEKNAAETADDIHSAWYICAYHVILWLSIAL